MRTALPADVVIASAAAGAVADHTQPQDRTAITARAWLDTLHSRAQIRAERRLRGRRS